MNASWWVRHCPRWLWRLISHRCRYDDPSSPDYVGFTAGICYRRGLHGGR